MYIRIQHNKIEFHISINFSNIVKLSLGITWK